MNLFLQDCQAKMMSACKRADGMGQSLLTATRQLSSKANRETCISVIQSSESVLQATMEVSAQST